jgi:tetratricopeptide (TPR) repeat protein
MLTKDMHKQDIDSFLEGKGDFVKIDYLNRYIKSMPPIELRKYAYLKLAEVFTKKEMFVDAAGAFRNAAVNSVAFREKQENYLNESKSYVSAGKFDESDKALKRAMDEGNQKEKDKLYAETLEYYRNEAKKLESKGKPGHLVKLYEKMMRMKFPENEKDEIRNKLLHLYEKLGKVKEYKTLKGIDY